ncbi:hypothetical protein L208DRAFT_1483633 [Tricholoma matsutake]|nr:hypothetical protein L208DRAFT_1483633 [Tricholoma matsutake 945]
MIQKSQEGDDYNVSPYRLQVAASLHLLSWTTLFAIKGWTLTTQLLGSEAYELLDVSIASLAPNTQCSYASGLLHFTQFCDSHEVSEELQMLASGDLLAGFLANVAAHRVSYDCAKNWMSGLQFWHSLHGAPWNGKTSQVDIVHKGVKKHVPATSHCMPRSLVTMQHMYTLQQHLSTSNSKDVALLALAEATFWGTHQLGKTTPPSVQSFDSKYQSDVPYTVFHIPWSKTTGFQGTAPLFAYTTGDGGWEAWTQDDMLSACNGIWVQVGLESVLGHSFQIGRKLVLYYQLS